MADTGADVTLAVSEISQLSSLETLLNASASGVAVLRSGERPDRGELGAPDILLVAGTTSGLITAIKVLPEFLRARKSSLSVTATVKGKPFTVTATNIDEVMPVIERLLDG